jgi:hypothetical protein
MKPTEAEMPDAAAAGAVVSDDLACAGCGYNLRTLESDGRCPECGLAVIQSITVMDRDAVRYGISLLHEGPAWLRWAGIGFLAYVAAAVGIAVDLALIDFPIAWSNVTSFILLLLVMLGASWLITRPSRGDLPSTRWYRQIGRVALVGCFIFHILTFLLVASKSLASNQLRVLEYVFFCVNGAAGVGGFLWLRALAVRMRRRVLARLVIVPIVGAAIMLVAALQYPGWIFVPSAFSRAEFIPSLAMIGGIFSLNRYSGASSYATLWFILGMNGIVLLAFGVELLRMAGEAARRFKRGG